MMTKLRLLKKDLLKSKSYIEEAPSYLAQKIIMIRLNMVKVKENFRRKNQESYCRLCKVESETTEHMLTCPEIDTEPIDPKKLTLVDDLKAWKGIVKRVESFERKVNALEGQELPTEEGTGNYELKESSNIAKSSQKE